MNCVLHLTAPIGQEKTAVAVLHGMSLCRDCVKLVAEAIIAGYSPNQIIDDATKGRWTS